MHFTILYKKYVCPRCCLAFASTFALLLWRNCPKLIVLINNPGFTEFSNSNCFSNVHHSHRVYDIPDPDEVVVKVYKQRWWILFVFASMGFMQCSIWNSWGPVTDSVKVLLHWDDTTIALLSLWATVTLIVGLVPFTIMLQKLGLRIALVFSVSLMSLGTFLRLFFPDTNTFTIFAHTCAILNGFGGVVIETAPSFLSSVWFPPHERTLATGIGCTFNQLGNAGGFFLGPLLVRSPGVNASDANLHLIKEDIINYMWLSFGLTTALLILTIAYFPSRPPNPPSLTSAIQTVSRPLKENLSLICSNGNFWLLMLPYSLTLGISVAWSSILDINLHPLGITQSEAGLLGVFVTIGGVAVALLVSKLNDAFFGYTKLIIIVLMTLATCGFVWFLLLALNCLPNSRIQLFASIIIGGSFNYGCSPLFFELGVELAYPVPEGLVGGILALGWNMVSLSFLLVMQIPMKSVLWMDYLLAVQGIVVIAFVGMVKEEYRRSRLDHVSGVTEDDHE